jgi:DNA-binding IscR family transcriptional regulator
MGALKRKGVVSSEGGRGGGWVLLRPLDELTVLDVQDALDDGPMLAPGVSVDHPACPVERATNAALTKAFGCAEIALRNQLSTLRLSTICESALADGKRVAAAREAVQSVAPSETSPSKTAVTRSRKTSGAVRADAPRRS